MTLVRKGDVECTDETLMRLFLGRKVSIPQCWAWLGAPAPDTQFLQVTELLPMCQSAQGGRAGQVLASTTISFPSLETHLGEWGEGV